jgi:hypothetical protein
MQTTVRGTSTLFDAPDGPPTTAARQSFALAGAQDFFQALEPPLRFAKVVRRV